jgi:hypothetical protein
MSRISTFLITCRSNMCGKAAPTSITSISVHVRPWWRAAAVLHPQLAVDEPPAPRRPLAPRWPLVPPGRTHPVDHLSGLLGVGGATRGGHGHGRPWVALQCVHRRRRQRRPPTSSQMRREQGCPRRMQRWPAAPLPRTRARPTVERSIGEWRGAPCVASQHVDALRKKSRTGGNESRCPRRHNSMSC